MARNSWFTRFAKRTAHFAGRPAAFMLAAGFLAAWAVSEPLLDLSDHWQVFANITGVATFLMVFLIQNTQNRDTAAIQIKLDELIRVTNGHNALMDLEELDDAELEAFRKKYEEMAARARRRLGQGADDAGGPGAD